VTAAEFRAAIAEATEADALRTIVDQFVPIFIKLPEDERRPLRNLWNARLQVLGVRV